MLQIHTDYQLKAILQSQIEAIRDHLPMVRTAEDRAFIAGQIAALRRVATACNLDADRLASVDIELELAEAAR